MLPEWKTKLNAQFKQLDKQQRSVEWIDEVVRNGGACTMTDKELTDCADKLHAYAVAMLNVARLASKASKMCHAKVSNRVPNKDGYVVVKKDTECW